VPEHERGESLALKNALRDSLPPLTWRGLIPYAFRSVTSEGQWLETLQRNGVNAYVSEFPSSTVKRKKAWFLRNAPRAGAGLQAMFSKSAVVARL
jgi:hypothetical protein